MGTGGQLWSCGAPVFLLVAVNRHSQHIVIIMDTSRCQKFWVKKVLGSGLVLLVLLGVKYPGSYFYGTKIYADGFKKILQILITKKEQHQQIIILGNGHNLWHFGKTPVETDRDYRFGSWGDCLLHQLWRKIICLKNYIVIQQDIFTCLSPLKRTTIKFALVAFVIALVKVG